jgi:putative ABC transport system permease protein
MNFPNLTDQTVGNQGQAVFVAASAKIVGVYRPASTDDPFWFGHTYFNAHFYAGTGTGLDTIDAVFVDEPFFAALTEPSNVEVDLDYPLDVSAINLSTEPTLRSEVRAAQKQFGSASQLQLTTGVLGVLAAADHERSLENVATNLVTLQLALLAWFVLFRVVADTAEAKGNEIALAKLRGLTPRSTVLFGLGEPLALLLLAIPLGVIVALLSVTFVARAVLVGGTPIAMTWTTLLGAIVGFSGGLVAAALAARRTLTRPVLEQWRWVPQNARSRPIAVVADVVIAALALVCLVLLDRPVRGNAPTHPVTLLGPSLLVLAVALLGVRLLPLAGRAALSSTRGSPRVGAFLAVRQVLRRPAGFRLAALLAVAIGLATFAISAQATASANRRERAGLAVGASTVLSVQQLQGHDAQLITEKVDPAGRWAMAAATWLPDGGPVVGTVVAVDSSRLAAVANWPVSDGAVTASAAAATLHPPSLPEPLIVTGTALRVRITRTSLTPGPLPHVGVLLQEQVRNQVELDSSALEPGTRDYPVAVPCTAGCQLAGVVIDRAPGDFADMNGAFVINRLQVLQDGRWVDVDASLNRLTHWRNAGAPGSTSATISTSPAGLAVAFTSNSGPSPTIGYVTVPQPLPVLATSLGLLRAIPPHPPIMQSENDQVEYTEAATVAALPNALNAGVLADLTSLRQQLPAFDSEANWQVWIGPNAPPDAVQRLEHAGLLVQGTTTVSDRLAQLGREGPSLALDLLVGCAIAGALLAAGATALAVATSGRRRAFELAALQAVGIPRRSLRRSCVGEQLVLLGTGLVLGVPAGIVAAWLTLRSIPVYADTSPIPMSYAPNVPILIGFAVLVTALVVLTAWLAGRALMHSAVPDRLREAA